jgi:hypothetical protein
MPKTKTQKEEQQFTLSNPRSAPQTIATFLVEVSGFDRHRKFFTEQTSCSDVGAMSCDFRLRANVGEEATIAIRSFHWKDRTVMDSAPVLFQVVRVEEQAEGRIVGAVRTQPSAWQAN